jgi:pimeloyl-ACP methyl ester carboxylesterase
MSKIRAFCIRGLGYFPSGGMAKLAIRLNAIDGVAASDDTHGVFGFEHVGNLTEACRAAHGSGRRIVLIGHSFGANAACMIAARLATGDALARQPVVPVALLAAIDPAIEVSCQVARNVGRALGWYQKVDPVGRGVIHAVPGESDEHWAARSAVERRDQPHVAIDDDPVIHAEIVKAVEELMAEAAA